MRGEEINIMFRAKPENRSHGEVKASLQEGILEDRGAMQSRDPENITNVNDVGDFRQEDSYEFQNTSQEQVDASLASFESWYRFDLFDQQRGSSQWLNFWS